MCKNIMRYILILVFGFWALQANAECPDYRSSPTTTFLTETLIQFSAIHKLDSKGEKGVREWAHWHLSETLTILGTIKNDFPECFTPKELDIFDRYLIRYGVLVEIGSLELPQAEPKLSDLISSAKDRRPNIYNEIYSNLSANKQ